MKCIEDIRRIHIVGVAGAATSGLAQLLRARGLDVSGSDRGDPARIEYLRRQGVDAIPEHRAGNISSGVDVVVHSAAVPPENQELSEARRRGIPVRKFAEFLGELVRPQRSIAVAGTHGKTSTAGMLASIFVTAELDPSYLIGGEHRRLGGNWRFGLGPDFIVEACEYDYSFLSFRPKVGIVTSLELDHPEVYPDEAALITAFCRFVAGFEPGAPLIVNGDDPVLAAMAPPPGGRLVTFGTLPRCDWRLVSVRNLAAPCCEVHHRGRSWGTVQLSVPGGHNVNNALAALALATECGVEPDAIREGLLRFDGMKRRFQVRETVHDVVFVDDYAHHPTEVGCALDTAREVFPDRRLWAVFQPHQWGRLQAFGEGFARALIKADVVGLLPVFSVRERPEDFPADLLDRLGHSLIDSGVPTVRLPGGPPSAAALWTQFEPGDVCVLLGAGDITHLTTALLRGRGEGAAS